MNKPPMPPQPTTVALQKPPDWAIALTERVAVGFASVNEKVDSLTTSVEMLQHDAKDTRLRLGRMEREIDTVKDRQNDGSIRVRQTSENDLKQDAALAQVMMDVAGLKQSQAKQTEMITTVHSSVVGVLNNPKVRFVGRVLWMAALGYAGLKGMKLLP